MNKIKPTHHCIQFSLPMKLHMKPLHSLLLLSEYNIILSSFNHFLLSWSPFKKSFPSMSYRSNCFFCIIVWNTVLYYVSLTILIPMETHSPICYFIYHYYEYFHVPFLWEIHSSQGDKLYFWLNSQSFMPSSLSQFPSLHSAFWHIHFILLNRQYSTYSNNHTRHLTETSYVTSQTTFSPVRNDRNSILIVCVI